MNDLPPVRIGHIADLHLREAQPGSSPLVTRRSRWMSELFPRALAELRRRGVDFLSVTGDLVDAPHCVLQPDDYYDFGVERWIEEAETDYRRIKEALDECGIPYMVLPGNHDPEKAFWRVFDPAANVVDLPSGWRIARFCDREGAGHVPRRLDRERTFWEGLLKDEDPRPQIHLQHYLIAPKTDTAYPQNYFEHEEIRRRTAESGRVVLSLSGHRHEGTGLIGEGSCHFAAAPAFSDFPHPFHVYDIGPQGVTMEALRLLDEPLGHGRRTVFLDRDGVITLAPSWRTGPEDLKLVPGAAGAMRRLREAGFATVVVSSQSCVGAGYATKETVHGVMDRMCRMLRDEAGANGAQPDAILFSVGAGERAIHPRHRDRFDAKPSPKLLLRAAEVLGTRLDGSYMVGDSPSDLQAGRAAGATPILTRTGNGRRTEEMLAAQGAPAEKVVDDLSSAVDWILGR